VRMIPKPQHRSNLIYRPTLSSLTVPRNLFPYVTKIFHAKVLKIMGKLAPWKTLNHMMEVTEVINASARDIYETKKRLLESGDSTTVKQVGDGKDIMSLLSTSSGPHFTAAGLTSCHCSAS
jgi:hypothetical protein